MNERNVLIRRLSPDDLPILERVAPDVFDLEVDARLPARTHYPDGNCGP